MSKPWRAALGWLGLALLTLLTLPAPGDQGRLPAAGTAPPAPIAAASEAGQAARAARGARSFTAWCNSCHPGGQAANGPVLWGRGLAMTPARIRAQIRTAADLRERARFQTLSDASLDDIIAFIQERQHRVDATPP